MRHKEASSLKNRFTPLRDVDEEYDAPSKRHTQYGISKHKAALKEYKKAERREVRRSFFSKGESSRTKLRSDRKGLGQPRNNKFQEKQKRMPGWNKYIRPEYQPPKSFSDSKEEEKKEMKELEDKVLSLQDRLDDVCGSLAHKKIELGAQSTKTYPLHSKIERVEKRERICEDEEDRHHQRVKPMKVVQRWLPKEKEPSRMSINTISASSKKKNDDDNDETSKRDTRSTLSLKGKSMNEVIEESSKGDGESASSSDSETLRTTSSDQSQRVFVNVVENEEAGALPSLNKLIESHEKRMEAQDERHEQLLKMMKTLTDVIERQTVTSQNSGQSQLRNLNF